MAKYNRPNGKLFGSSATNIGVFGSGQQNETPATSTDPNTINGLGTHWEQGWDGAVVSQAPYTAPYVEDMNAVNYVNSYNSAYLLQRGIPEYSATEEYQEDSVCTYNGEIWICLQDNTVGQTPAEGVYWHLQGEVPIMNDNEILVGAVGGTPTVVDTNAQGDILASASGLDIKANTIVNADVADSAGIVESKLSLDYSTQSLYDNIENHKADTNNPHSVTKSQVLTGDLIVNSDVDDSAGIVESKLSLDYSTTALNTNIENHKADTSNPHDTKISNLDDVTIASVQDKNILAYDSNSSKWKNITNSVNNLDGVSVTTPAAGQVLTYDGSNWTNQPNTVENLQNTNISTVSDGQILSYDSGNSEWVNTTNSIDNLSDTNISSANYGDTLFYDGNDWINQENSVDNLSNTNISSASTGDVLTYDGLDWINQENSVENLSNVNISGIADGDILVYDANSSTWINSQGGGGGGGSGDLGYKNLTGFPVVQYKKYFDVTPYNAYWNFVGGGSYNLATQTNVTWSGSKSVNTSPLSSSTDYYFMYSASHGTIEAIKLSDCIVSSTAPAFNQATCWFNTTTKVFKYGKGASDWDTTSYDDLCVPLCMYRDGKLTHLYNEIASSFLNYLFIYPDTKYLHPKWRNQNTGEYINDVEYLSGSSNLMKDVAVNTSTYSGLDFFVRNDNNGSSFTLLKKSAIYFCEESMYYGKVIFPYNTSFTVGYSYSENVWATIWGSGTKFGDKQSYMGGGILANMDSNGIIRNIDTLDLYDRLVTKKFLNSVIEVYDIANINSATSNIILTSSDKRHQILTASNGFNITLPSANIKAGEKFILEFTHDGAFTSTSMSVYVGSTFYQYAHIGNFNYIYTALVDNPTLTTDWLSEFRLRKPAFYYKASTINGNCTQNTRECLQTGTMFTVFAGIWNVDLHVSYTSGGTIDANNPWVSYLVTIAGTSPYARTVLTGRGTNDIVGFSNLSDRPKNRSQSISDVNTNSYDCWNANNVNKSGLVNILKRSANIGANHSIYNTSSTYNLYCNTYATFDLKEPVRTTNIS